MDYLSIGSVPYGEPCAQVGSPDYSQRAKKEGKAFIAQLKRQFGEPPPNAYFKLKSFPHDFGSYYEVCVVFNENDEEAVEFAYKVENEAAEYWDEEGKLAVQE